MRVKAIPVFGIMAIMLLSFSASIWAEEKKAPSEEEMMAIYMKYAAPGEHHKMLEPLVGSWEAKTRWWTDPAAPPDTSSATAQAKWILGGRFVMDEAEGMMMGMPFHGMGITGYDNYKQQYINVWLDEMSTSFLHCTGAIDATGKVITMNGTYDDFATGQKNKTFKSITRIISNDKHVYEMYELKPDGKEFMNFEVTYTRKK